MIVRDGNAIPPRGSTELCDGDELHILVRGELRDEVEALTDVWTKGPIGKPAPPPLPRRAASQVFTVRPERAGDDLEALAEIDGIPVLAVLRSREETGAAMVALADGRYAVTGAGLVADRRPPGTGRVVRGARRAARGGRRGARLVAGGHRCPDRQGPDAAEVPRPITEQPLQR